MNATIRTVELVSDGLLVEFGEGTHCYFSAPFLLEHIGEGSNQIFLTRDPSVPSSLSALPLTLRERTFNASRTSNTNLD